MRLVPRLGRPRPSSGRSRSRRNWRDSRFRNNDDSGPHDEVRPKKRARAVDLADDRVWGCGPLAGTLVTLSLDRWSSSPGNASTIVARLHVWHAVELGRRQELGPGSARAQSDTSESRILPLRSPATGPRSSLRPSGSASATMAVARGVPTPDSLKPAFAVDVTVQPVHPDQSFALISGRVDGSYLGLACEKATTTARRFTENRANPCRATFVAHPPSKWLLPIPFAFT